MVLDCVQKLLVSFYIMGNSVLCGAKNGEAIL